MRFGRWAIDAATTAQQEAALLFQRRQMRNTRGRGVIVLEARGEQSKDVLVRERASRDPDEREEAKIVRAGAVLTSARNTNSAFPERARQPQQQVATATRDVVGVLKNLAQARRERHGKVDSTLWRSARGAAGTHHRNGTVSLALLPGTTRKPRIERTWQ